jgi:hypothetical protein
MEVGEADALIGQLVENGSLDRPPVTAEIAVAQIVDE